MDEAEWGSRRLMVTMVGLVEEAWQVMAPNLEGLTDEEYFWEPVPGCWGVRRRADLGDHDAWGCGEWAVQNSMDGSREPTMTTIGWRLMHAYDCTADFTKRAFGEEGGDWNDIEIPGSAETATALMKGAMQDLHKRLSASNDDALLGPDDEFFQAPRWRLLDKAMIEAIHHCAEIGVLRALYAAQR